MKFSFIALHSSVPGKARELVVEIKYAFGTNDSSYPRNSKPVNGGTDDWWKGGAHNVQPCLYGHAHL